MIDKLSPGSHDGLACATEAVALYSAALDEAARLYVDDDCDDLSPTDELRDRLPALLATLSPAAREAMCCHVRHFGALVAFVHHASPYLHT